MLVVFLILYYFFYRKNININKVIHPEINRNIVNNFIGATRRVEKSLSRRAEAFESLVSTIDKRTNPEKIKKITYLHKVLNEDIFESYRTLMEAWSNKDSRSNLYQAIEKGKEYISQASLHASNIKNIAIESESISKLPNEALNIMVDDLDKAIIYLERCSQELNELLKK